MRIVKQRLVEMMPFLRVFLDVDECAQTHHHHRHTPTHLRTHTAPCKKWPRKNSLNSTKRKGASTTCSGFSSCWPYSDWHARDSSGSGSTSGQRRNVGTPGAESAGRGSVLSSASAKRRRGKRREGSGRRPSRPPDSGIKSGGPRARVARCLSEPNTSTKASSYLACYAVDDIDRLAEAHTLHTLLRDTDACPWINRATHSKSASRAQLCTAPLQHTASHTQTRKTRPSATP